MISYLILNNDVGAVDGKLFETIFSIVLSCSNPQSLEFTDSWTVKERRALLD